MVQINHAALGSGDTAYFIVPLLSLAVVLSAVISLVGIKLWWFKHRLTFDQSGTRNGAAGGSQPTVVTRQYSSRDKRHSQQFQASVEVHGVFRKRQEDELEFVRPAELPPVRIRKLSRSTPSLLLLHATRNANGSGGGGGGGSVAHSDASKYTAPPTREPPRPPITGLREVVMETSTIIEEEAPPFADFEQSFQKANATRSSHSVNDGGEEASITLISPKRINRSISNDSKGGGQKFLRAKGASDSSERRRERRPTGYLPPDQDVLQAMQQQDTEAEKQEEKKNNNNNNSNTNNSGDRKARSYLRYEDIDRDGFDDYRYSWEGATSKAAAKDTDTGLEQLRSAPTIAQRSVLDVTMSAYDLDGAAVPTHAVELTTEPSPRPPRNMTFENRTSIVYEDIERTPWEPMPVAAETATPGSPLHTPTSPSTDNEHDFEYLIEEKFDEFRHSFEQHEADFLETRVTVSEENQLNNDIKSISAQSQTKPQGYGRSIDEDWESFEQLNSTRGTICEKTNDNVVLETYETMTTTIRTIERGEYKEVTFDLSECEERGTDQGEPLRPQRRATSYVRDIEELYQELSLHNDEDIDISKLDIDSDGSAGSDAPPTTAAVIAVDVPKPKSRQKVTFDFKTEEHFLPSDDDHDKDPDSDEVGGGEPQPDMPKPMQRLTKMRFIEASVEGSEPVPSLPRAPAPTIVLFGSQHFADESATAANDSWSAVRQHRYLTEELQQLSPTLGQDSIAAPASVGAAHPAFRNPLAQQPTAGTTDLFVQPRTMRDMKRSQARQNTTIRLDSELSGASTEAGC